ncbi:hypothetical protein AMK16_22015 [Streptomyces sp. CB00455]|uniref:hypothetical protein n=1 Tax=Streptomyces sp. CB00455 TaxID=1703927 RepID=UPI00093EC234|nr:hypothetical protein [Streptomyces sp. CB00455]OKK17497.1 hypothetical protein AMK16_22015 [Streptomyces sp. CB00455]
MTPPEPAPDFRPTHVVPQEGLAAWEAPDVSRPTASLDPLLPVQLLSRRGEWGEIMCANGWSAWVDGRLLVAVPQPPPTAGGRAPGHSEDPRPQLERSAGALERYRRAVADLAAGRCDTESFHHAVRGLRAGVVLDGESVWLFDETAGRWMYGDGSRLATYAVVAGPGAPPGPQPPPAQAAPEGGAGVRPAAEAPGAAAERAEGQRGHAPTRIVDTPGSGGSD